MALVDSHVYFGGAKLASTLDTDTGINTLKTSGGGGGGAATIANGADATQGNTADAPYSDATGATPGTNNSIEKGLYVAMRGTGANAQNVQGAVAQASTTSVGILPTALYGSSTAPTAVTAGQWARPWGSLNGATATFLADSAGNLVGAALVSVDSIAATTRALAVQSFSNRFNGATWDRERKYSGKSRIVSTAAGGSPTVAKASAADLGGAAGQNGAAITYLQFYDTATTPVVGTTAIVLTFPIPANAAFSTPSAWAQTYFGSGLAYAFTTDAAGTTGAAAAAVTAFSMNFA